MGGGHFGHIVPHLKRGSDPTTRFSEIFGFAFVVTVKRIFFRSSQENKRRLYQGCIAF